MTPHQALRHAATVYLAALQRVIDCPTTPEEEREWLRRQMGNAYKVAALPVSFPLAESYKDR